jgi:HSP20 family protein
VSIDTAAVAAKYENGVLAIEFAKKEAAKPKQVKIEIGSGTGSAPSPEARQVEGAVR